MMRILLLAWVLLLTACEEKTNTALISEQPQYAEFVAKMEEQGIDKNSVDRMVGAKQLNQDILHKITHPAEAKSWEWYKNFFLKEERFAKAANFNKKNKALLEKAEKRFQVPANIISGILEIESIYGENTGDYPVIDALSTIGFGYPKRSKFFLYELETLLTLHHKKVIDANTLYGSYAGAFGWAQFMPDSYRDYAISEGDKTNPDLMHSPSDNVMSIANYLNKKGHWKENTPVMQKIKFNSKKPALYAKAKKAMQDKEIIRIKKTDHNNPILAELSPIPEQFNAILIAREHDDDFSYWYTSSNFNSILSYNSSPYYAYMVFLLSEQMNG